MAPRPRRAADDHRPDAAAREESGARGVDPAAIALYRAAEPAPDRADEAPPRRRDRSAHRRGHPAYDQRDRDRAAEQRLTVAPANAGAADLVRDDLHLPLAGGAIGIEGDGDRSEEHTSELQSLMRLSYAVFCLK